MATPFLVRRIRLGDYHAPAVPTVPVSPVEAPNGGRVWIVTDAELARQVLTDPRISKDPALAPAHWRTWEHGLEPPAAQQPSLTTLDGPPHLRLRRAHAPLFTARRLAGHADRISELAGELLHELARTATGPVDLTADFTTRFPLTVVCELLGVPARRLDDIAAACRRLATGEASEIAAGSAELGRLVATALVPGTPATELHDRLPDSLSEEEIRYLLLGLVFAGQVTTENALGFLVAHLLSEHTDHADHTDRDPDAVVREVLRRYPPAPFALWRFTTTELELAGTVLPPGSPVLVAIADINAAGHDLTFGAGPHVCIGAQLAQLELTALARVMRASFPRARLAVPLDDLPVLDLGIQGRRLVELPVYLT